MRRSVEVAVLRTERVLVRGRYYVKEYGDDGRIYYRREQEARENQEQTA